MGSLRERLARLQVASDEREPDGRDEAAGASSDADAQASVAGVQLPPVVFEPAKTAAERALRAAGRVGLDCETYLIQPGRVVPRLVVTGYQAADGTQQIVTGEAQDPAKHAREFLSFTSNTMASGAVLTNQNIPFDFLVIAESAHQADVALGLVGHEASWLDTVLRRIFQMLDAGCVEDTMLRDRLLDLADGTMGKDWASITKDGNPRRKRYDLARLARTYLGIELDKKTWRTGYAKFLDKPLEQYPAGAVAYLTDDVEAALHVATRQQERAELSGLAADSTIPNSKDQSKAAFAFALMSAHGVRTDLSRVQQLDADIDSLLRKTLLLLKETGLIRNDGTRDTKRTRALVVQCYEAAGLAVPLTKEKNGKGGGSVSLKGSVLEDIALIRLRGSSADVLDENGAVDETDLGNEPLYAYSQYTSFQKLANTYVPVLKLGTVGPINARYDIIKETGRVSCWSPNLTNLPRGGSKTVLQRLQSKVRQAFVPRPGFVFCSTDLEIAELCGLAQICIWMTGGSRLADAINDGIDPHLLFAAEQLLHIPYAEALARKKDKDVADMRQLAKSVSFGMPGGLGIHTFIEFAKASYNVYVTEEEARVLKEKYFQAWPEMRLYFRMIANMMRGYDERGQQVGSVEQFVSGRIRGKARYTAACNTTFQGLVADAAKAALYEVQRECYLQGGSMYGARSVVFVHDEIITELPEQHAHEYACEQAKILINTVQAYTPDVKIRSTPAIARAWYKEMEAVYDNNGRLTPWEPQKAKSDLSAASKGVAT